MTRFFFVTPLFAIAKMTGNNPSLSIERWFNKLQYTIDYCADIKRNDDSRYIPLSSDIPGILLIQKNQSAKSIYGTLPST